MLVESATDSFGMKEFLKDHSDDLYKLSMEDSEFPGRRHNENWLFKFTVRKDDYRDHLTNLSWEGVLQIKNISQILKITNFLN